ncbi:hypothetical protein [Arenibaculum sp.]|jgi:hypothetical protein|uniref:hypothetical protein n=1 Tax=Arenibaculum sp. TaxID=2865862 RepID=UPI002E0D8E68|nr:hypothetical protein [Arenibaculum sp.]
MSQVSNLLDKRAFEGRAFMAGYRVAANTGQYSAIQLQNPGGSGRVLVVRSLWVSSPGNTTVLFGNYDIALPNLVRRGQNVALSGPEGVGVIRWERAAAPTPIANIIASPEMAASEINLVLSAPLLLYPGIAVVVTAQTPDVTIDCLCAWEELNA